MDKYRLTQNECDEIFSSMIFPRIIEESPVSQKNPQAYILGGQPGAGKSHFIRILKSKQKDDGLVVINGDDLRGYHPHYYHLMKNNEKNAADLIQPNINYWIERLIRELAIKRISMIIEGTMRRSEVPIMTAKMLRNMDYEVFAKVIMTHPEVSNADIFMRFVYQKKMSGVARFTRIESHEEVVRNLHHSVLEISKSGLFENIELYYRNVDKYMRLKKITNERELIDNLEYIKSRELNDEERKYVQKTWTEIFSLCKDNKELSDFLKNIREQKECFCEDNEKKIMFQKNK